MYNRHELAWSRTEKKVARHAFDLAYSRELHAIRREVEAMLRDSQDDRVVWRLEDYLFQKRRETDRRYDYRYSMLMLVFLA